MPSNNAIVADAGPLIALGRIDALALLAVASQSTVVPEAVEAECLGEPARPGAAQIAAAFRAGVLIRQPEALVLPRASIATLGPGESAAIELAEALRSPILIDERRGRAIATARGLTVVGTLAVLVLARRRGAIDALSPVLDRLNEAGYHLSDALVRRALASVGE